jgi:hypothetical protein
MAPCRSGTARATSDRVGPFRFGAEHGVSRMCWRRALRLRPSTLGPQLELDRPAQHLGDLLVITIASRCPQRVGERRPLTWSSPGLARPAATPHGVGDVLRLGAGAEMVRPHAAHVASVPHHRVVEHTAVGDHRPATPGDDADRCRCGTGCNRHRARDHRPRSSTRRQAGRTRCRRSGPAHPARRAATSIRCALVRR